MGQGRAMRRTLGKAEELFASDAEDVEPPSWMQFFRLEDLYGMQALAYRTLAEHDPSAAREAQLYAQKALVRRAGQRQRSVIFDELSMASACFIGGDVESADAHARIALAAIGETSSHRTWDRLREMYRLTGRYADYRLVGELREEIQLALPHAPNRPRPRPGGGGVMGV
jgi:hypothetical protein